MNFLFAQITTAFLVFLFPIAVAAQGNISGTITDVVGEPVSGVEVRLEGGSTPLSSVTNAAGNYAFPNVLNGDYTIIPSVPVDCGAGCITPADRCLMLEWVNNGSPLSPLQVLAGDVNGSGSLSAIDGVDLGDYLAGKQSLPDPCFRFLPKDYVFLDPDNPWAETLPEAVNINDLTEDVVADFHGLRLGDINGCAVPPVAAPGSLQLGLNASVSDVQEGENFCVSVTAEDYTNIAGFQFVLTWEESVGPSGLTDFVTLPGIFGEGNVTGSADGNAITVFYQAPQNEPFTLNGPTTLLTLCFVNFGVPGDDHRFVLSGNGTDVPTAVGPGCGEQRVEGIDGELVLVIPVFGGGQPPILECPESVTVVADQTCLANVNVPAIVTDP
ncbi:MAG: carboxypeptidase regulatory-like domain-containing protein, partial [Bacteroidota bacterium]